MNKIVMMWSRLRIGKDGGADMTTEKMKELLSAKDMKRNFVTQLNNTNKMSPTLYLTIEEFEY